MSKPGFCFVWPTGRHTLRAVAHAKEDLTDLPKEGLVEAQIVFGLIDIVRGVVRVYEGTYRIKGQWFHIRLDDGKRPRKREKKPGPKLSFAMGGSG